MAFATRRTGVQPDVIAPDGSEVRVLCATARGSMATFTLSPGAVSKAILHRSVEELWYILSGAGHMWRRLGEQEEITELAPGVSLSIPVGTRFQFRCGGAAPLSAIGTTMPPWPGPGEAVLVDGPWPS